MTSSFNSYRDWKDQDEFFDWSDSDEKKEKTSPFVVALAGLILLGISSLLFAIIALLALRIGGWENALSFKQAWGLGVGYSLLRLVDVGIFRRK